MSDTLLATDGMAEQFVVVWFPPEGDRSKTFEHEDPARAERAARKWAKRDSIAEWNPLLEHRIVITTSELLPL